MSTAHHMIKTVGSVCSGIEAASVAWRSLGAVFHWFSEIAPFPSQILREKYPHTPNVGDMTFIPQKLLNGELPHCDLICGGTPCQAFSLAGWKNGLNDNRGNLTLKFVDIIEANDAVRTKEKLGRSVVFWENVEGVLTDKTNAFGCLVSSLAGLDEVFNLGKWPSAGLLRGPKRNVAWRVLDAKFFGVPQQRRRLYLLAGDTDFHPEHILFELHKTRLASYPSSPLRFKKDGHFFEVFREYTDCLYSAYGTKWNGNAAANNGSLFVVQDRQIRRLSPLECERLMGFPDNYTNHPKATRTTRYQAIGNSWTIPVIRWIGKRLFNFSGATFRIPDSNAVLQKYSGLLFDFRDGLVNISSNTIINCTATPEESSFRTLADILSPQVPQEIYISPVGCYGMVRRKNERRLSMNARLEEILLEISSRMPLDEIEKRSRVQKRGQFSLTVKPLPRQEKQFSLI